MNRILIVSALIVLGACSVEPGSEKWCAIKEEQPKTEWSASDVATYAKNCLIDGTAIGSDQWCEDMSEKPKGEWTANEAAEYAKNCVM